MPKIVKLKSIDRSSLPSLTSRGIKSALKDPIKLIQKTLDKIYSHLIFYIESSFSKKFNLLSPSVNGIDEAIARIKKSKMGKWGSSVELEGDFGDLYSNCNEELLLSCVKTACKLANFSDSSFNYIKQLISCVMRHSYFLEPTGTFKTLKGFSMGDCSAARGSEVILRVFELNIWKNLCSKHLNKNVLRFCAFATTSAFTYLAPTIKFVNL